MDKDENRDNNRINIPIEFKVYPSYNESRNLIFEYDEAKSLSNAEKHGIDFEEVQELWNVPHIVSPVEHKGERRYIVVGRIFGICWTVIATNRGENIRIISARRSTRKEISHYDRQRNKDNP